MESKGKGREIEGIKEEFNGVADEIWRKYEE
jgi:hypothetical protein